MRVDVCFFYLLFIKIHNLDGGVAGENGLSLECQLRHILLQLEELALGCKAWVSKH